MNYRDYSDQELRELYAEDPDDVDVAAELHWREDHPQPVCEAADDAFLPADDPRYGTPCSEHCPVHGREPTR